MDIEEAKAELLKIIEKAQFDLNYQLKIAVQDFQKEINDIMKDIQKLEKKLADLRSVVLSK
jgi:hypothetical protein